MIHRKIVFHRKVFLFLLYFIVFVIPIYGRLLPFLIGLLIFNWLIEGNYLKTFKLIFLERPRFILFSFSFLYFLYLAGLIHTGNYQYAGEDLMTKLTILVFPLIFATSDFPVFSKKETMLFLRIFAAGCIAGSLMLLGRAFYYGVFLHQTAAFYYSSLSWSFHPSYYAMYIAFAASNILYFLLIRQSVKGIPKLAGHILILLFFTLVIVLLSSKAGLLIWLSVIGFYTFMLLFKYQRWLTGLIFVATALTAFVMFLLVFPNAAIRVSEAKQGLAANDSAGNSGQSTGERVVIWKASKEIIRKHFLVGVGTGDVKDALLEQYEANNYTKVLGQKLNAHNQYIQTFITLGILGLVILLAMMAVPAIESLKQESYIYCAFLFIVGISMFFESMLETQAGVVFYALFNALLYTSYHPDPAHDPPDIPVSQV